MNKKRVTIALRLSIETGRRKLAGILRCIDERKLNWDIRLRRDGEEFLPEDAQAIDASNTDGIIVSQSHHLKTADRAMRTLATRTDIPLVAIGMRDHPELAARRENAAFIEDDVASLGILAAEHFLGQGVLKAYGFVPARSEQVWNILRGAKFAAALKLRGLGCKMFRPPRAAANDRTALVRFLTGIPKPCGILAAYDDRALDILEAAREAGFTVPDDVSVMGISNDELLCTHASPPLTSIKPDHESQGYAAAELLDKMINAASVRDAPRYVLSSPVSARDAPRYVLSSPVSARDAPRYVRGCVPHPPILEFPPERIVVRESTTRLSYAGKLVQRALAYVQANAMRPIGPEDVANALGVSRRLLDLRFGEMEQGSVGEAIRTRRLEILCERLRTSEESIEIVTASCGFANAVYAKQLFREKMGMTMRDYRKRRTTV